MTSRRTTWVGGVLGLMVMAPPALAHHSFAVFDHTRTLTIEDVEPGFYGYSVGRWEGETLVVDTIGIKENVRFQNMPHSPQMRIKERLHLVSPTVLWNEITIEDPVVLEKPHTYTVAYRRMPNYTLLEYVCEDNREYADDKGLQKIRVN